MSVARSYLDSAIKEFTDYKKLGDRTFEQLNDEEMHFQPNEECNSIAINIQHMNGNMLSRWTNFLEEDGEKEWRQRDAEFEGKSQQKQELLNLWEEGWKVVFDTVGSLKKKHMEKTVHIRSKPLKVIEAINRQISHYSYHVGQIVLLGKWIRGKDWQTLSVPKASTKSSM